MLTLCFIDYEIKLTLASMKKFKASTGKDLWHILIQFIEVYTHAEEVSVITRLRQLYEICDFETASHVFNCIIVNKDKSVSLDDIQDGMFRVGWRPTDREGEKSEPWPLLLVSAAFEIDKQFEDASELEAKKKAATVD